MSIYNKIIELSTPFRSLDGNFQFLKMPSIIASINKKIFQKLLTGSIAIVSVTSLVFNILFPHAAMAKEITGNNVITFNFSEIASTPLVVLADEEVSSGDIINIDSAGIKQEEKKIIMLPFMLPVEPVIKRDDQVRLVITEVEASPTNDEIADRICKEAGVTEDLPCWQDLKAMRIKESYDGKAMVGDGGRSRGWYHIQTKMHNVTVECALDFECSTEWTVKNLITHNYMANRFYAISKHNGGGKMAQAYAKNVVYNSAKFEE